MIYDCFMFFDELELLEVRLHELADVVDRFVLVESPLTFAGNPKPLHFADNQARFRDFADRIVHVVADLPLDADSWARERRQRNAVLEGLAGVDLDSTVLVSDVDEIPRASAVRLYAQTPGITVFRQSFYYYWLNCRCAATGDLTRMASYSTMVALTPHRLRQTHGTIVENGGWHFSYMGGVDRIRTKIRSFAHQELNTPAFTNAGHIAEAMASGRDLYGRPGMDFQFVALDDSYPRYILTHHDRFRDWIGPPSLKAHPFESLQRES